MQKISIKEKKNLYLQFMDTVQKQNAIRLNASNSSQIQIRILIRITKTQLNFTE